MMEGAFFLQYVQDGEWRRIWLYAEGGSTIERHIDKVRWIVDETLSDAEFCADLRKMAAMAIAQADKLQGSVGYGKPWPLGSRGNGSLGEERR